MFQELGRRTRLTQQGLDFAKQLVIALAHFHKKASAFAWFLLKSLVVDLLDLAPAFWVHSGLIPEEL
jgi:hypothetical protein